MGIYLSQSAIYNRIDEINIEAKTKNNLLTGFTIGSTSNYNLEEDYYLTPIRYGSRLIHTGVVVKNVETALQISAIVDGKVDYIFIDSEKKIDSENYGLHDSGNLEKALISSVKQSKVYTYRANDITVQALDLFLRIKYPDFTGKKISIIGMGNIGFKTAWSLLECGNNISVYSRTISHSKKISEFLNYIKPVTNLSRATYSNNIVEAIQNADIIIGTSNQKGCIKLDEIVKSYYSSKTPLLIDVGKGTFDLSDDYAGLPPIYRIDVGYSLTSSLENIVISDLMKNIPEKKIAKGKVYIKKGIVGKKGDLIVDDPNNPTIIYGECDGIGNLLPIKSP